MPTMPTAVVSQKPPTFRPHTKQFRPTTVPMQPFTTPAMFRDDREHKGHKEPSISDVVSEAAADQSNKNLNITPDMASKILKLIEAKSQSFEKAHKAAAAATNLNPAATTKLKHLLEEKLPEATSLIKDEENVELPTKHDQAKATSIATQHSSSEDDEIEYPSPKLPSSSKQNSHKVNIVEPVKKLPLIPQIRENLETTKSAAPPQQTSAMVQPIRMVQPTQALTQGVGQKAPIPASSQVNEELVKLTSSLGGGGDSNYKISKLQLQCTVRQCNLWIFGHNIISFIRLFIVHDFR